MKRLKFLGFPWMLISVLIVFLLNAAGVEASSALQTGSANASKANACGVWSVVSSPNSSASGDTNLAAVAALTPSDAWTVGSTDPSISAINSTLTEHWDGSKWSMVSTPNVGSFGNELLGVAAV